MGEEDTLDHVGGKFWVWPCGTYIDAPVTGFQAFACMILQNMMKHAIGVSFMYTNFTWPKTIIKLQA